MITSRLRYSQFKMSQFKVVKPLGALTLNGLIHKSISHRASLLSYASREAIREAIKHHWLGDLIALTMDVCIIMLLYRRPGSNPTS